MDMNIDLLGRALQDLAEDMKTRGIGAILWDNSTAGFDYIPEVVIGHDNDGADICSRICGIYHYEDTLYLAEEDKANIDFDRFYDPDTEVRPVVITLTEDVAVRTLGNPTEENGYTTDGSLEEWLAIADCYFQALNEKD